MNLDKYEIMDNEYIVIKHNTTKNDFINSIYNGIKYEIKLNSSNEFIATGDKLEILDKDDNKICEYIVVVLGDINGDGIINKDDVLLLSKYIISNNISNNEIYYKALDVDRNTVIDINDVIKMVKYIKNTN